MSESLNKQVGGNHYKQFAIQPVEFCYVNKIPYLEATAIKYLCRWKDKGGIQDLEKAKHYIEMLIELEEKNAKPNTELGEQVYNLPDPRGIYRIGDGWVQPCSTTTEG